MTRRPRRLWRSAARASAPPGAEGVRWIGWDIGQPDRFPEILQSRKLNAVVWAQGINFNDDIYSFDIGEQPADSMPQMFVFVLASLQVLLKDKFTGPGGHVYASSARSGRNIAKQKKMSLCHYQVCASGPSCNPCRLTWGSFRDSSQRPCCRVRLRYAR